MAVNSFVENVNKLAISLYGDGTTPVDFSIITNNIEAITFLYDYISNGGELGASTVIENVSVLPSVSTEGTIVYLNTNNKLYVFNGASWDVVGGSITVVGTKPVSATIGDIIYLTTDGFLYTWDGLEWDKVGGGTTTTSDTGIFVTEKPTTPTIGDKVINILDGSVSTWDGTQWVVEEYTPHASSMTSIKFVTALPLVADSKDGDLVYNETDGITYIFKNGAWVNLLQDLTPNASGTGIEIVAILPLTVTNGKVVYNSADKKLYEGVNGVWTPVVEATTASADVADASITVAKFASGIRPVETLSVLPTTGNSVGRMVYLTTDGQLYRYTASGFTTAVPAQAITGTIGATQIAPDAITTEKISAGAITADEIGANAITAGKIAVGAVTAGTIQAGAISATEIASNAITTDKIYSGAITAIKLSANSVDATKIVAGSITASLIGADAINAGHIQAGAIGASEISAGAITASKIASYSITSTCIQAGAITATEIASNAITATHILAGSITASKLDVDALIGKRLQLDSTAAASSYVVNDTIFGSQTTAFSFQNTNRTYGMCSVKTNSGAGSAIYGLCSNDAQTGATIVGVQLSSNVDAKGALIYAKYNTALMANTGNASGQWAVNAVGKVYASGGYSPFTGSHICYTKETLKQGELVYAIDAWVLGVDNALIHIAKTTKAKDKRVIGVVSYAKDTLMDNISKNPTLCNRTIKNNEEHFELKAEYKPYVEAMQAGGFKEVSINSLGEGGLLVCAENGNIEAGDYLVSANKAGYAMRQEDDVLHSYTVAKALESVDWAKEAQTTKMIAVTYHAG